MMMPIQRVVPIFAAIVALAVISAPGVRSAQRDMRERHVYVGVSTGNQMPVQGLTPADFTVREDGLAREVLRVEPAPPPTHIALLVDDSEAVRSLVTDLRGGLSAFVRAMVDVAPEPLTALTTFGERPTHVAPYAIDPAAALRGIERIFGRPSSGAYFMDAVVEEAAILRKLEAARPVMVAFVAEEGREFSNLTSDRVSDALKAAQVSLWTISLQARSPDLSASEMRERAAVLTDVARRSGGESRAVLARQALTQAFTQLAGQIQARYDVVYARPDMLVPPERLQVEVKRSGVRVASPSWAGQ